MNEIFTPPRLPRGESAARARSDRSLFLAAVVVVLLLAGVGLRWAHLGAEFHHFDEVFPSALIARFRTTGSLDMNIGDADVPAISRYNQYAGSSYHYAVLFWDAVTRRWPGWPADDGLRPPLVRLRAFSALLSSLALLAVARMAWSTAGPWGAAAATALAAFNPTLVQDAHYARPDAFLTLLTLAYVAFLGGTEPLRWGRVAAAAMILGILVAAKNTMGLLAVLPVVWLGRPGGVKAGWASFAGFFAVALFAFLAAEPGSWLHYAEFREGVERLRVQYSHPFPIVGALNGGGTYGMALAYFAATLGAGTAVLALLGVLDGLRNRDWRRLLLYGGPAAMFGAYFGSKTIFFERAYSPVLPGLFLLAGAGVGAVARLRKTSVGGIAAAALIAIAAWPAARVCLRFTHALSGAAESRRIEFDRRLSETFKTTPLLETPMWNRPQLEVWRRRWTETHSPFILRVADYGDAWTASIYPELLRELPAREIQVIPGPFAGLPVSSLQVYHVPTWRYVWVGPMPAEAIPRPRAP